jgi:hypothetical protein
MCENLSRDVESTSMQRGKTEYWVVSTIANTREVVGRGKHGFCVGTTKDT